MNPSTYQKLPGRGRTWGGPTRVWLGPGHLLLVLTRGYVENYRRFFFDDIHGILVVRTHTGKIWNTIWGALFGFFGLIAVFVTDTVAAWVFACLAAPFGLALGINLFLGPMCACYIRTAVQTERIPAVSRLRAAEKFRARVEPLIVAAQGELAAEEFTSAAESLQSGQLRNPEPPASGVPPVTV